MRNDNVRTATEMSWPFFTPVRARTMLWSCVRRALLTVCVMCFLLGANVYAQEVHLAWDAPTVHEDGTPLTDLAGYRIYWGTSPRVYATSVTVDNVTDYELPISGTPGTLIYIAVTARDGSGNESAFSNEISYQIPEPDDVLAPGAPANLRVISIDINIRIQ